MFRWNKELRATLDAEEFSANFYDCCKNTHTYDSSTLFGAIKPYFLIRCIRLGLLRIGFGSQATDL